LARHDLQLRHADDSCVGRFGFCVDHRQLARTFLSSYVEKLMTQFRDNEKVIVENVGQEAYQQQLVKLPLSSAADLSADYFLKSMIIGLFLTIIISVILRRQPKTQ
jgi:hypothetical protein